MTDAPRRTALVTGATGGIGRATSVALAERGFRVLLVGRDRARGEDARREVEGRAASAGRGGAAELFVADLSRQAEVRRLADEVRGRVPRLDVLVNNAGALFDTRREVDGVEATMALNHVAYFLLTTELLGPLRAAAAATGDARVVAVSSSAHEIPTGYAPDDLRLERRWSSLGAYGHSKLANVLFAYALARRMAGTGVTANALHPGVIASGFGSASGGTFGMLFRLARPFLSSPEKGARTSVYLASDPAIRGATGGYYKHERPARSSRATHDVAAQDALWAATERAVG